MKYFLLLFSGLMFAFGCSEDFLNPKPLSFYSPESTIVDKEGMDGLLATCNSILREEYHDHMARMVAEVVFTDIAIIGGDDDNIPIDMDVTILPDNATGLSKDVRIQQYWEEWYKMIKNANLIVNNIDNAMFNSEDERNAVLGEAYFYRAFSYYRLVHQFGDVPLILDEITSPRVDFYSFSRESILNKMKEDMILAVSWLPNTCPFGKVNKAAGNHLLAKIYLALGEFDNAIKATSDIINDGIHSLMKTRFGESKNITHLTEGFQAYANGGSVPLDVIYDLHRPNNKSIAENKEAIFNVIDRADMDGATAQIATMRNLTPFWHRSAVIKTPSGVAGMMQNFDSFGLVRYIGRGEGYVRGNNWSNYEMWTPDDLRHKQPNWWRMEDLVYNNTALIGTPDEIYYGKHIITQDTGLDSIRCWAPFSNKFCIPDPRSTPNGYHSDWYVFRLAETFLIRAEAYFWKGELDLAAKDVNEVHERAGCKPIPASEINIGVILDERAKELYWEENRKSEMTRMSFLFAKTGKTYNGKTYSLDKLHESNFLYDRTIEKNIFYREHVRNKNGSYYRISPRHFLWPVPAPVINANTQGRINQTLEYPGAELNVPVKEYPQDYVK
jgi:hypothetical protein